MSGYWPGFVGSCYDLDSRMIRIDSPGTSGIDALPGDETLANILARGRAAISKAERV